MAAPVGIFRGWCPRRTVHEDAHIRVFHTVSPSWKAIQVREGGRSGLNSGFRVEDAIGVVDGVRRIEEVLPLEKQSP